MGEQVLLGLFDFLRGQQIGHIPHADAVMGVEGGILFARADSQPVDQPVSPARIQGMEHQHGQCEVIHPIAPLGDFLLDGIVLMDFG